MKNKSFLVPLFFGIALFVASCQDHTLPIDPNQIRVTTFASQLINPMGLSADQQGRVWVTEVGTGKNDGRVSVVMPNGTMYPVITGFASFINPQENVPVGLTHLLYYNGTLYILHGNGMLYKANVSSFVPGTSSPMTAASLPTENVGQFVLNHDFGPEDTGESNPYNIKLGPGNNIYIVDAAANSIIHRPAANLFNVFATMPRLANTTNPRIGPPMIDPVPTGLAFDGILFYVSNLTGFPFIPGKASIHRLLQTGVLAVQQTGFTTLVDIELGSDKKPLVLHFADFGPQGFIPNTGSLIRADGSSMTNLVTGLNMPTDIEMAGPNTLYVASMGDGTIKKVSY